MTMNWLDWLLVMITGLSTLQGLRTGLMAGVARLLGLVAGIAAAYTWYRPLAVYFDRELGWGITLARLLQKWMPLPLLQGVNGKFPPTGEQPYAPLPGMHKEVMAVNDLTGNVAVAGQHLAHTLLELFSFVLILFVVTMSVSLMFKLFSGLVAATPLGLIDRFGGLGFGLVRGIIIILLLAMLLQVLAPVGTDGILGSAVKKSLFMPHIRQVLDLLHLHLPGFQPAWGALEATASKWV